MKLEAEGSTFSRMAAAVEVLGLEQRHQTEALDKLKSTVAALGQKVDAIEKNPGKRWDNIVWEVLKWGVLLLLGIAAVKAGLA